LSILIDQVRSSSMVGGDDAEASPLDMPLVSTKEDADVSRNSKHCDDDRAIQLLGEIVGGYKLTYDDSNNEDEVDEDMKTYCIVKFGNTIVHKTLKAEGGRNPIWTCKTGAHFIFEATPSDLVHQELQVSVWTKRRDPLKLSLIETSSFLGKADIDLSKVLLTHGNEERLEVDLQDLDSSFDTRLRRGTLTLRFRLATPFDVRFLTLLHRKPELLKQRSTPTQATSPCKDPENVGSLLVTEANETQKVQETFMNALSSAFTSKTFVDKKSGQRKVLVKPNPDPANVHETTYLSALEISTLTLGPSTQWIEAGSGTLGKVYLEILSCKDLPNVDVGEAAGNFTDAFVTAVFEDAMAQTEVINDELSPHWLPWVQRAFIFKMMHPASTLFLAVFDYDIGLSNHESLGRVAVNISNLQRDTDYTLTYNIYPSSNVIDRTAAGSITIRLRIEYSDEKEALMAALRPRPTFHINVRKEKSLAVLRYTCFGEYGDDNEHPFDLTVTRSYVNEILEYKRNITYCFGDAIRSLVFWRGQVRVFNILLPIHSFLFFCFATTLVERPYLAPSFFLLSVAWIMLATQTLRMQHPSPWHQCHSLWHYLNILKTGQSSRPVRCITANQGAKEAEAYEKEWQDRLEKDERLAAKQAAMQQEIADLGDDAIHTKLPGGIPLDLFVRLTRYQGIFGRMCKKMRLVKSIVTWEEGAVSFWITFCFLASGLVSLILPWSYLLLWGSRIIVWGLFGPHMMLLDWWLRAEGKDEAILEKAMENFKKDSWFARIRRQDALKLRDMKCVAFGKYITLVPAHNLSRHFDRPLPASSARLHNRTKSQINIAPNGIPGQQLFGTILPRTEYETLAYEHEFVALQKLQSEVVRCIKTLKDSENCSLLKSLISQTSQDEDLHAEVGYGLISCNGDEADNSSGIAGTKVQSLNSNSNVAILRNERRASSHPLGSSEFRRGYEPLPVDKEGSKKQLRSILKTSSMWVGEPSASADCKSAKDRRVKQTHSWSDGDVAPTSPGSHARRLPSLMETDEGRECGEVEVILAVPVREGPSTGDPGPDGNAIGAEQQERIETSGKLHEASIELNGSSVKVVVADDESFDLGSFLEDDDASSCIVYYQPVAAMPVREDHSTEDLHGDVGEDTDAMEACGGADNDDEQQQNNGESGRVQEEQAEREPNGGMDNVEEQKDRNEASVVPDKITKPNENGLQFVVPEDVMVDEALLYGDVSCISDYLPPTPVREDLSTGTRQRNAAPAGAEQGEGGQNIFDASDYVKEVISEQRESGQKAVEAEDVAADDKVEEADEKFSGDADTSFLFLHEPLL
jgi:C2 domain